MIRKIEVTDYPRLVEIWESAVSATHDFLKEEDFRYYKQQLPTYLFCTCSYSGFVSLGIVRTRLHASVGQ